MRVSHIEYEGKSDSLNDCCKAIHAAILAAKEPVKWPVGVQDSTTKLFYCLNEDGSYQGEKDGSPLFAADGTIITAQS